MTNPRVVIVGGGFDGLYAARALAGAPVRVTLIDKRNYHLFRPLLYQAATGLLSADEISGPLRSILSRQNNIDVLLGEATGVEEIDPKEAELDSVPESERWDPVPGSEGHKALEAASEDEDDEGRIDAARLFEKEMDEAEHETMLKATKNTKTFSTPETSDRSPAKG